MRLLVPAALAAVLTLSACQTPDAPAAAADTTAAAPVTPVSIEGYTTFGTPSADTTGVLPAEDVTAAIEEYAGKPIQISGTVLQVCQAAGCWATIATPTGNVRVAMPKDSAGAYVFTLPKDISGRRIIAEGTFEEASISKEHFDHMQEDAATQAADHAEMEAKGDDHDAAPASGETVQELRLTATGVLVRKA